jgi:transcriptional regulator PpsR
MDMEAVITDVRLSNAIAGERFHDWVGRAWVDTVADVGGDKVRRMVSEACASGFAAFRQVNQLFPSGLELPIEYTTVRVGGQAGLMAIGKSLQAVSELQARLVAAQHAMERDYWKLREVETRYRLLFDASAEAVLLLRADDLQVAEANPAAIRALGIGRGWDFPRELPPREREQFLGMLALARETGKAPGIVVHLGIEREPWTARATLANTGSSLSFILQLTSVSGRSVSAERAETLPIDALIEKLPDGFVVLDRDGIIRRANRAFLDLVQAATDGVVLGQSLQQWMGLPGADLAVLLAAIRRHGPVRLFPTALRGELGTTIDVEISAAGDQPADPAVIGLAIRDVSRRIGLPDHDLLRQALGVARIHGGTVPLRTIVDEVVGLVERDCVESALERTDGNRAAAAELLGMSRQSLYAKLARYGLDGGSRKSF